MPAKRLDSGLSVANELRKAQGLPELRQEEVTEIFKYTEAKQREAEIEELEMQADIATEDTDDEKEARWAKERAERESKKQIQVEDQTEVQSRIEHEQREMLWAALDNVNEECRCSKCETQVYSVRLILETELRLCESQRERELDAWKRLGHTCGRVVPVNPVEMQKNADGIKFRFICSPCYEEWLKPQRKECKGPCKRMLPGSMFHKHPKTKDRKQIYCRDCMKLVLAKYKKPK